jgi:alkanesulfonate monooxygenase SsuD/methylene tetrahydromethanopterin reductase-like flavin-dependent oxidoreductase (luciferase family)
MQFGLFLSMDGTGDIATRQLYREAAEQMELADEAGFDHVWFPEHHFVRRYLSPAPLLHCVDAVHRTRRVRVGTSVILTPYHHPLVLAEQIAVADQLTDGRLDVGFARGASLYEAERMGIRGHLEAAERQQETLDILLGAWRRDEDFGFEGKYYSFPPVYPLPRPYQQPHPPLWVAARSGDTMRYVVERGLGLQTQFAAEPLTSVVGQLKLLDAIVAEVGQARRPPVSAQRGLCVTEDPQEAVALLERVSGSRQRPTFRADLANVAIVEKGLVRGLKPGVQVPLTEAIPIEELRNRLVIGDPETCVQKLRDYEALGFDEFVIDPIGSREQTIRSLRLFAKHVLPHFRKAAPDRPSVPVAGARMDPAARARGTDAVAEAAIAAVYDLGPDWRTWETRQWVAYVEAAAARGEPRRCYVFDFALAPRVKGGVDTYVDGERKLSRITDVGCPECGRPVVALFHRREGETVATMRSEVTRSMIAGQWHPAHQPTARREDAFPGFASR